jgi:hypothetical protein
MKRFYFRNEANDIFGCEYLFPTEEEMYDFMAENWPDSSPYDGGDEVVLTVGDSPRSRFAVD